MRIFVAIRLPDATVNGLEPVRDRLREFDEILRYPHPSGLHITLAFLGEQDEGTPEVIEAGLRVACADFGRFKLDLGTGGSLPEGRPARILSLRIEGEIRRIRELQGVVVKNLRQLGFQLDDRPFSPHLTIARVSRRAPAEQRRRLTEIATGFDGYDAGTFEVSAVTVMASNLMPTGAVYTPLAEIPL